MIAQPTPVAALIAALIDVQCLSLSLAASRADLGRFPDRAPWPTTPSRFKDYLEACERRPGNGPLDKVEARKYWDDMTRANKCWQSTHEEMSATYRRWAGRIEDALALLPKLVPLLEGQVARPWEWTSRLRSSLYDVRSVVIVVGDRPWVIEGSRWTAHLKPVTKARCFLQAADFTESMKPLARSWWTKKQLCHEGGISSGSFGRMCEAAGVPVPEPGQHSKPIGRANLRKLVKAARSGLFPRIGHEAADAWSLLLDPI